MGMPVEEAPPQSWRPAPDSVRRAQETVRMGSEKLWTVAIDELGGVRPKLALTQALIRLLPHYAFCRLRTHALRIAGFSIGRGTTFFGAPVISGDGDLYSRLTIGTECAINVDLMLDLGASVTIGNNVSIGHQVMILTTSHKVGATFHRAGPHHPLPVTIGNGAWLCARSTILPGVDIGAGAIVSAGAVVSKSVPPNSVVAGCPAQIVVPKLR
jgi:maltose O-acetyltransferase